MPPLLPALLPDAIPDGALLGNRVHKAPFLTGKALQRQLHPSPVGNNDLFVNQPVMAYAGHIAYVHTAMVLQHSQQDLTPLLTPAKALFWRLIAECIKIRGRLLGGISRQGGKIMRHSLAINKDFVIADLVHSCRGGPCYHEQQHQPANQLPG